MLPDLFEGARLTAVKAEAQLQDLPFPGVQRRQEAADLFW
jgi:hypothetical protein